MNRSFTFNSYDGDCSKFADWFSVLISNQELLDRSNVEAQRYWLHPKYRKCFSNNAFLEKMQNIYRKDDIYPLEPIYDKTIQVKIERPIINVFTCSYAADREYHKDINID